MVKHEPWFPVRRLQTHLGFDANFDDAARDCEDVADDQEDVPAIDELQAVGPAHFTAQDVPEVLHVLLTSTQSQLREEGRTHTEAVDRFIICTSSVYFYKSIKIKIQITFD